MYISTQCPRPGNEKKNKHADLTCRNGMNGVSMFVFFHFISFHRECTGTVTLFRWMLFIGIGNSLNYIEHDGFA